MKVIEHFAEREMPSCILHPKTEGVSFEYNLKAWLNIISPGVTFRTEIKKIRICHLLGLTIIVP